MINSGWDTEGMRISSLSVIVGAIGLFMPLSVSAACVGYSGPGGPCSTGPGGGLSTGPGGGLSTGPGGGLSTGPGGGLSTGPGGGWSTGPGGGLSTGPGGGLSTGPGGGLSTGPGGGLSSGPDQMQLWELLKWSSPGFVGSYRYHLNRSRFPPAHLGVDASVQAELWKKLRNYHCIATHSRASLWASVICLGAICRPSESRAEAATFAYSQFPEALKFSHIYAST